MGTDGEPAVLTEVILLQDADVPDFLSHGYLLHSALVQAELLGHIDITVNEFKSTLVSSPNCNAFMKGEIA